MTNALDDDLLESISRLMSGDWSYWWGPFNMSEARHEYDKRQDMYCYVRIVKDVT